MNIERIKTIGQVYTYDLILLEFLTNKIKKKTPSKHEKKKIPVYLFSPFNGLDEISFYIANDWKIHTDYLISQLPFFAQSQI